MKKDKVHIKDWKHMEAKPFGDPDFSPEHNARVIASVDQWNDEMDKQRDREYKTKTEERSHAAAMYLQNLSQGHVVTKIDQYFGKRELGRLRAQEIVGKLQANPALMQKLKRKLETKGKVMSL